MPSILGRQWGYCTGRCTIRYNKGGSGLRCGRFLYRPQMKTVCLSVFHRQMMPWHFLWAYDQHMAQQHRHVYASSPSLHTTGRTRMEIRRSQISSAPSWVRATVDGIQSLYTDQMSTLKTIHRRITQYIICAVLTPLSPDAAATYGTPAFLRMSDAPSLSLTPGRAAGITAVRALANLPPYLPPVDPEASNTLPPSPEARFRAS
jgi:hypothetical protein